QGARERGERLILQKHFEPAHQVEIPEGVGGHGGGDAIMLRDIFQGVAEDPLGRTSDHRDGFRAIAVGICGNISLQTGAPVDVAATLGTDLARTESSAPAVQESA
ncbi:MAG: gfo/Idh/MocA family oxidoreductase, partial [Brachybacterium sp.]